MAHHGGAIPVTKTMHIIINETACQTLQKINDIYGHDGTHS
jgi:hypothetical protein